MRLTSEDDPNTRMHMQAVALMKTMRENGFVVPVTGRIELHIRDNHVTGFNLFTHGARFTRQKDEEASGR